MNIFITGAGGFVGSHLKEYLQQYYPHYSLLTPSSKELDLANESAVDDYILSYKIDMIINCANRGGGRDSGNKNIVHENLRMFFNIVKHSDKVSKIIHFGSGAEYSKHKPIVDVKEEDADMATPLDEYGFYKSVCSKFIEKSDNNLNLRIFGCYGEYENYRFKFISNAIVKNLLHLPITINKNVFFDYIYVDDLVRMVDFMIHNDTKAKIFNISTGQKVDLVTLATIINEVSDFKSEIRLLNEGLNNEYTSNNTRVLSEMGDFEFTSHKDAIIKMREYFKQNLDKLDVEIIKEDPYLKVIDTMWKKG